MQIPASLRPDQFTGIASLTFLMILMVSIGSMKTTEAQTTQPASSNVTQIKQLIKDLQSDDFETRENATETMMKMGDEVIPYLEQTLETEPTLDMETRVKIILSHVRLNGTQSGKTINNLAIKLTLNSDTLERGTAMPIKIHLINKGQDRLHIDIHQLKNQLNESGIQIRGLKDKNLRTLMGGGGSYKLRNPEDGIEKIDPKTMLILEYEMVLWSLPEDNQKFPMRSNQPIWAINIHPDQMQNGLIHKLNPEDIQNGLKLKVNLELKNTPHLVQKYDHLWQGKIKSNDVSLKLKTDLKDRE